MDFINQSIAIITNDISFTDNKLLIDELLIDNLEAQLSLLNLTSKVADSDTASAAETTETTEIAEVAETVQDTNLEESDVTDKTAESVFPFRLNRFAVTNFKQLTFIDENVDPAYKRTVFIDEMYVNNID